MTGFVIPVSAVPSQVFTVQLSQQACKIALRQRRTGLFVDLSVDGAVMLQGVLARDRVRIVRDAYHGFTGDLFFMDTQGADDPDYTGLGSRWMLCYSDTLP